MNTKDLNSLREFFRIYEGLTDGQLAILADRSISTITDWKRRCGIIKNGYCKPTKTIPLAGDYQDTKEWFEKAYSKHGLRAIGKMIGKNWQFVARRLKKYGIRSRTHEEAVASKNPCCTEDWLYYHYARRDEYLKWCERQRIEPCPNGGQGLTLRACAKLADASRGTIQSWLALFKMKMRGLGESAIEEYNHMYNKSDTPAMRRRKRDKFFEGYRAGKINIVFGNDRFSNGTRVDKAETINRRFNAKIRST